MHIVDLLQKESIELNASVATKDEAIDRLIALQNAGGNLSDIAEYKKGILAREALRLYGRGRRHSDTSREERMRSNVRGSRQ
jgi:PTS system fructose-specific IIC component